MFNVVERHVETTHKEFSTYQNETNAISIQSEDEVPPINYLKQLHRCGVRTNDNVLVVGTTNIDMLKKMAQLVSYRGKITVLGQDSVSLERLKKAAEDGQFKAFKQFTGGHPAFDLRAPSKKHIPIEVTIEKLTSGSLLFANDQFDVAWIEHLPQEFTILESDLFASELKRVTNGVIIRPGI